MGKYMTKMAEFSSKVILKKVNFRGRARNTIPMVILMKVNLERESPMGRAVTTMRQQKANLLDGFIIFFGPVRSI
ncbi:hypothetical protein D3C72_2230180 [compost metagenome]